MVRRDGRTQDPLESSETNTFLRRYVFGSVAMLFLCLLAGSATVSWMYVRRERERASLSLRQFEQFFRYQYRPIAEEMFTKNYTAIRLRLEEMSRQFGNADFSLQLADSDGHCVYEVQDQTETSRCHFPSDFVEQAKVDYLENKTDSWVRFNPATSRYLYFAPLYVGTLHKGYLFASFADPYEFFRGGILWMTMTIFLPTLFGVLILWILWLVISHRLLLRPYLARVLSMERKEALGALASQVAHDIRSPLAALDVVCADVSGIQEDKRLIVRAAVGRIRDIANQLLERNRTSEVKKLVVKEVMPLVQDTKTDPHLLSSILESIVSEKRMQHHTRHSISIETKLNEFAYGVFAVVNERELKRAISNIIDNAVEALNGKGRVEISLEAGPESFVDITVRDDGCGISPSLLPKLGRRGATFGKAEGSGLGLFHARKTLKEFGGQLFIESVEGTGTCVRMRLPRVASPAWFANQISLTATSQIFCIDDDVSIHRVWARRFEKLLRSANNQMIEHFSSPEEFWSRYEVFRRSGREAVVLMDFEFIGSRKSGLDWLEEWELSPATTYLVTSRYMENDILQRCQRFHRRIVPKELAAYVPLHLLELQKSYSKEVL